MFLCAYVFGCFSRKGVLFQVQLPDISLRGKGSFALNTNTFHRRDAETQGNDSLRLRVSAVIIFLN